MSPALAVSLVAVFVSVGLLSGTATWTVLRRRSPHRKRLRELAQSRQETPWREPLGLTHEPNALAGRICRVIPRSTQRMTEMRQRLVSAGYRSAPAPVLFAASQIVCAVFVGVVTLGVTGNVPIGLLGLIVGFVLPGLWVSHQVRKRSRIIQNGLPDVLDLLIVCLESGSSLDAAILKSGEELALAYRPLGDELALVANEIRAGKPRCDAFANFADRTRVDDVRSLVAMLVQTDRYGTSMGQALRTHADLFRTRRRQRAEERAAKASVKLVFPLVFCLFPAFYLITLGPALLQFLRVFMDAISSIN
jgi:tight adherence protein C